MHEWRIFLGLVTQIIPNLRESFTRHGLMSGIVWTLAGLQKPKITQDVCVGPTVNEEGNTCHACALCSPNRIHNNPK